MTENNAKQIFTAAIELPPEGRTRYLDEVCAHDAQLRGRVEDLLAAHGLAASFLENPSEAFDIETVAPSPGEAEGQRIGRYKLLQQIGEGGFGTVWMAEQQVPIRRMVALKIIKRGMDTRRVIARFEAERQALAMMDHPNIAKVFDGGETPGGRPFFVMELVRGVPITQFCDEQHLEARERLELFTHVCHAVHHAHQKGILHRDIKPSNILVTLHDGVPVPKVIDFGIAKATHRPLTEKTLFTEFRRMVGTPEYMAPEQAEMSGLDVDTRADIYSLGVVLYELLTGTKPLEVSELLEKGYVEVLRVLKEDDPHKPSTRVSTLGERSTTVAKQRRTDPGRLGKLLRGDVDWIVMKALEKDRARRYESASAFAADVRRHLDDEPVLASPPSRAYKLLKYVRRNRLAVTAGAAVFLALVIGAGLATKGLLEAREQADIAAEHARIAEEQAEIAREQANRARMAEEHAQREKEAAEEAREEATKEQQRAEDEAATANRMAEIFRSAIRSADPHGARGADYTVREFLDEIALELGDGLPDQPNVASTLTALGRLRLDQGDLEGAEDWFSKAIEMWRRLPDRVALATSLDLQGHVHLEREEFDRAGKLFREALDIQLEQLGPGHAATRQSFTHMIIVGSRLHSEAILDEFLGLARASYGDQHRSTASALVSLGELYIKDERYAEAEPLLRECVSIRERVLSKNSPAGWYIYNAKSLWGASLAELGRYEDAEDLLTEAYLMMKPPPNLVDRKQWALERLVKMYEDWDNPDRAQESKDWKAVLEALQNGKQDQ